jgi:hypothetical protein
MARKTEAKKLGTYDGGRLAWQKQGQNKDCTPSRCHRADTAAEGSQNDEGRRKVAGKTTNGHKVSFRR